MGTTKVDITGSVCYFCGRDEAQLESLDEMVREAANRGSASQKSIITKLENGHDQKISEALEILNGIDTKLKLITIRSDFDAFVGKKESFDGRKKVPDGEENHPDYWIYSRVPAINIVREILSCGIPIGQDGGNQMEYLTSIREYVENLPKCFDKKEKKQIYDLYESWVEITGAEEFGYAGHQLEEDSATIRFEKLLPMYLEWVPLMFKNEFEMCEDHIEARKNEKSKRKDTKKVPPISLQKLTLNSGNSKNFKIVVSRCTICADQIELAFDVLSTKKDETRYG